MGWHTRATSEVLSDDKIKHSSFKKTVQTGHCPGGTFCFLARITLTLSLSTRYRGLYCLLIALLASAAWLFCLPHFLGMDLAKISREWTTSWFFFGFAALAFYELWPFVGRVRQPVAGLAAGLVATFIAILAWEVLSDYWVNEHLFALFSYTQFFLFTIGWFFHNAPFAHLSQPTKGTALAMLSIGLGILVYLWLGPLPQSFIFFVPEFLFFFFADWPIPSSRPWRKGFLWTILILAGSLLTDELFTRLGAPLGTPRGSDLVAVIFAAMLVTYSIEDRHLPQVRQPALGLLKIAATLALSSALACLFFRIIQLDDYVLSGWVWVCWCFQAVFYWFTVRGERAAA